MWSEFLRSRKRHDPSIEASASSDVAEVRRRLSTLSTSQALFDRSTRALLEVTGADRAAWLHNLTTNQVRHLKTGEGCYAFACNVQGRILFDLNVLVQRDVIWIDIDRGAREAAIRHFRKYLITEDVAFVDRSDDYSRAAVAGPGVARVLAELGARHAGMMAVPAIDTLTWNGGPIHFARVDVCGVPCVDVLAPPSEAMALWAWLCDQAREHPAVPVDADAVEIRRIEAGVPAYGREITDEYLPAETRQLDRAVSFTKGCYLGQEVIERMRSRKVVARLLTGFRLEGDVVPPSGAVVADLEDKPAGLITSACAGVDSGGVIALGYVKAAFAEPGGHVIVRWEAGRSEGRVAALPFVGPVSH